MRIADNMLTRGYLKNLSRNQQNVQNFHQQLSSMKEVSKPSDNPLLVSQIIELKENGKFDYIINNNGTLKDLFNNINKIC